jgi:hypothetical protein
LEEKREAEHAIKEEKRLKWIRAQEEKRKAELAIKEERLQRKRALVRSKVSQRTRERYRHYVSSYCPLNEVVIDLKRLIFFIRGLRCFPKKSVFLRGQSKRSLSTEVASLRFRRTVVIP